MHLLGSLAAQLLGLVILILRWLLVRAAERAMKRSGTNIRPEQPNRAIVAEGPFRFTRNPVYLASTGPYLAVTLLVNTLWPVILPPFMLACWTGV